MDILKQIEHVNWAEETLPDNIPSILFTAIDPSLGSEEKSYISQILGYEKAETSEGLWEKYIQLSDSSNKFQDAAVIFFNGDIVARATSLGGGNLEPYELVDAKELAATNLNDAINIVQKEGKGLENNFIDPKKSLGK